MPSPRPVDSPPRPSAHSPLARSSRRGRVGASALPEARRAAWLAAVAVAVAVVAMVSPATAGRPNVLDNFLPPCPTLAEPTTYKKWSDPATWAPGPIPGRGDAIGANVTIACGEAILLDTSPITLTLLNIRGFLRVLDSPALPKVDLSAAFIVVQGNFSIGTPQQHYRQRIKITLTPNPNNRADYLFTENLPAEPAFPRNLGHKAFAVVGGQVDFHGMPGGSSTPAWTKLTATAQPNDLVITVQDDVSAWPQDAFVVVTSTDYFPDQAEVVGIIDVVALPSGGSKIFLEKPLRLMHFGDPKGVPDGYGGFVDQRAEVALLNRSIAITGTDEPAPYHREGGHFMIFMSNTPQFIEGVEFAQMGQQGKLGRYNIHFHVCGDDAGRSVVRKNVMHDSKQRCVVVHTTFNLTVEENVAYHTRGHCFMVEEGGETDNTFLRNLGIWTRAVEVLIPLSAADPTKTEETDDAPSTFWITNPNNNFIGNVAAGSENSGYWMELRDRVRGFTLSYPGLNATVPANGPFGIYRDNVAHSNRGPGWRTYPKGVRPRQTWSLESPIPQWQWKPSTGTISGLLLYKQSGDGLFVHNSDGLIITNSTFADNRQGLNLLGNTGVKVTDSRFIGVTPNYGNPRMCDSTPQMCGPVTGCDFPLAAGQQGRSQGWSHWKNPIFGIIIDHPTFGFDFARAHAISNCQFHAYDSTCRLAAAIGAGINGAPKDTWATATSVQAVTGTPGTNMLYFPPRNFTFPGGDVNRGGEATDLYTLWDKDGSLLNATAGGYLLANNTALLPPTKRFPACQPVPAWNAYACPGTCYRTVMFTYLEPGFAVYANSSVPDTRKRGDFSYLSIRRIEDDTVITVDGNLRSVGNMWTADQRIFVVPLLANATYEVNIGLPGNNRAFFPSNITVQLRDSNGCGGPVTLRIPAKQSNQWMIKEEQDVNWKACAGTSDKAAVQFSFVCFKFKPTLELFFDGTSSKPIVLRASANPVTGCRLPYRCGLVAPGSTWAYDVSGRELHAAVTGAMGFSSPRFNDASWPRGPAIIGYVGWRWVGINTWTPPSGDALPTFYYRRPFRVANSACATGLYVDVIVNDGVLLYLNGVEMLRVNMAPGAVNVSSRALSNQNVWDYTSFFIPLNATAPFSLAEGTNHIAAESHAAIWTTENFFDLKLSAQMDSATCSGVLILQEVCDGLDNNNDGKVDIDPLTDRLLTRPCRNPCGAGIETCIDGAFQNCTAPVHGPEVCNGVDDNCDGLIDNSPSPTAARLDCADGSLCFKGQCLPYGPLTAPVTVINKSAAGWLYYDKGYLPQSYPTWSTNSNVPARLLKEGAAPFGYNSASPTATNLSQLTSGDSAYFFLKSFALTEEEANNTWSYSASVQRDDGAVLLMNGAEFFRSNMPAGPITSASFAATGTWGADKTTFFNSTPFRSIAQFLQLGTNWVGVQLHQSRWSSDALFDLELTRHAMRPCSALEGSPAACVRTPPADTLLLAQGSTWAYNDASLPPPNPDTWFLPSFDDSAWLKGPAPLAAGNNRAGTNLTLNSTTSGSRVAHYFRRAFTVTDAACHVALTVSFNIADGAVVYLNGVEAYRFQMPPPSWGPVTPATNATGGYVWRWVPSVLSGGWLQQGANVIAVEVHQQRSTNTLLTFDVQVTSKREAIACTPAPQ